MLLRRIACIVLIIMAVLIIILILTMMIPMEFCIKSLPTDGEEDYYIVRYSRSKNRDILLGDKNGLYREGTSPERWVCINGNDPMGIVSGELSVDLYMQGDATIFIIFGTATIDESWDKEYGDTTGAVRYTIARQSRKAA